MNYAVFLISVLIVSSGWINNKKKAGQYEYPIDVPAVAGDPATLEKGLISRDDIIFFGGFEQGYNNASWKNRWGIPWMNRAKDNEVVADGFKGGKSLRVKYPEGGVGPMETGGQFPMVFRNMDGIQEGLYQELYLLKLKIWIDDVERLNIDDMRFRNVENAFGPVGGIFFSTFHGGNSADWAPRNDSYAQFDGFVIANNRVGLYND